MIYLMITYKTANGTAGREKYLYCDNIVNSNVCLANVKERIYNIQDYVYRTGIGSGLAEHVSTFGKGKGNGERKDKTADRTDDT